MISMKENEEMGLILPTIRQKYSTEEVTSLVNEFRSAGSIKEVSAKAKSMIAYGKANTRVSTAKSFSEIIIGGKHER